MQINKFIYFFIFSFVCLNANELVRLPLENASGTVIPLIPWAFVKFKNNIYSPIIDVQSSELYYLADKQNIVNDCVKKLGCFKNYVSSKKCFPGTLSEIPFFPLFYDPYSFHVRIVKQVFANRAPVLYDPNGNKLITPGKVAREEFEFFYIDLPQWLREASDDLLKFHIYYNLHIPIINQAELLVEKKALLQKWFNGTENIHIKYSYPQDYKNHHTWLRRFVIAGLAGIGCVLLLWISNIHNGLLLFMGTWPAYCLLATYVCVKAKRDVANSFSKKLAIVANYIDQEVLKLDGMSVDIARKYLQQEEKWLETELPRYAHPELKLGNLLELNRARQFALQKE